MNELHLFAGAGGGILGGMLLGHTPICAVEIEPYCRKVLLQRQRDGILPRFPIWDDVRTFDGRQWRGHIDVICGGFPCQDISSAGKGAGINGERSGLWSEFARIIGEVRPRFAFVENSPMLTCRGLGRVLGDLAALRYDAEWMCLSAAQCGANHKRDRIWILAHATRWQSWQQTEWQWREDSGRRSQDCGRLAEARNEDVSNSDSAQREGMQRAVRSEPERTDARQQGWWEVEPAVGRVAHGVANRVDRLRAIGNGQVPIVAATAFCELMTRLNNR